MRMKTILVPPFLLMSCLLSHAESMSVDTLCTETSDKLLPSIVQAPKLELKLLHKHLKYAYLREMDMLPVIISMALTKEEEDWLLDVLQKHKLAIGWTLTYIKGISPAVWTHIITLEENSKPC